MPVSIGRRGWIGVALETAVGSGGETPSKYIPYTSSTLHNVVEVLDDEAAKGIRERAWGSVAARTRGEGDVTMLLDVENIPYFLYPALGTGVTQGAGASLYQHIFTRKDSNPPTTLCMNINDTVETRMFHYGVVNTLELTFSDGWIEATMNILSQAPESGSGTKSITTENVMAFKDANVYFGDDIIEAEAKYQAGTGANKLTAFTLTINNNAEAQYESGSSSPDQISIGQFEVGGNYTLFFEDTDERSALENQTPRAMLAVFQISTSERILIEIPAFHLTERSIDTAPAGFVTENPTWVGDYDSIYGSIIAKVYNATSAYTGCTESSSSSSSSFSSSSYSSSCSSSCSSS